MESKFIKFPEEFQNVKSVIIQETKFINTSYANINETEIIYHPLKNQSIYPNVQEIY